MSKKTVFIAAIIVIIGGVVATFLFQRTNTASYELTAVERGDIVQEVSASGTVESPTTVDLQFKNSGKIAALKTEVGQRVAAGEVLVKQDADLLSGQLRQSQAVLKTQEYKLRSLEENKKKDYEDKYDIKAQNAMVKQAQADIEVQRARINETMLISPIDGVVVAINGEVGEIAKPETIIVSIISDDNLQIDVDISESTVATVEVGQPVKMTLDAFDDATEWTGRVANIDSVETIKGGAIYYKTTVFFDKEDARIRPGMTVNVWIKTAVSENTLFVPVSAVKKKDNKKIVQVLQEKQVVEKEVTTGLKNDAGMIEISSGLSQGEQVILGNKK